MKTYPLAIANVLYAKISGERLQDHWSSGISFIIVSFVSMSLFF